MVGQPDDFPIFARYAEPGCAPKLARPNNLFSGHYHRPMSAFPERYAVELKQRFDLFSRSMSGPMQDIARKPVPHTQLLTGQDACIQVRDFPFQMLLFLEISTKIVQRKGARSKRQFAFPPKFEP